MNLGNLKVQGFQKTRSNFELLKSHVGSGVYSKTLMILHDDAIHCQFRSGSRFSTEGRWINAAWVSTFIHVMISKNIWGVIFMSTLTHICKGNGIVQSTMGNKLYRNTQKMLKNGLIECSFYKMC